MSNTMCYLNCSECCLDEEGFFDFKASLKRMNDAANKTVGHFKAACISEKIASRRQETPSSSKPAPNPHLQSNLYAQKILDQYGATSKKPVHTKGDGSCLFHAASIGLSGFDIVSDQLRYFSAIELGINADTYQKQFLEKNFVYVSDDYGEATKRITKCDGWCGAWVFMALSSVIKRDICSVYPRMNGMIDKCAQILDTIFSPKERLIRQHIYIMWSRVDEQEKDQDWRPNHFIPFMEVENETSNAIDAKENQKPT